MKDNDIFNLDNIESVVRNMVKEGAVEGKIKLPSFNRQTYSIPDDYDKNNIKLKSTEPKHVRSSIEKICEKFEKAGYNPNIYTAVYEAVLNAFQHGHERDPSKKIILAYKMEDS